MTIDHTHDPAAMSWVASANAHPDFPIQNLPLGVFSAHGGDPRCGVAIGSQILDLAGAAAAGLLPPEFAELVASDTTLNRLIGLGNPRLRALRHLLFDLLMDGSPHRDRIERCLVAAGDCTMHVPTRIGDYTDFYAGIVHATNVGLLLRPDNPLMPNYKHIPIGYHGRASSIRPSGTAVRRPRGQIKRPDGSAPTFAPSERLDYEVELGLWIGSGNLLGDPIPIAEAAERIAGVTLLNDWSARDIQAWEYQPLGPFLAKSFATTVSPWLVTAAALDPFRVAPQTRAESDPALLPYLRDAGDAAAGGLDIAIEVFLRSRQMIDAGDPAMTIGQTNATHLYWTPAQMVAHHSSNGCNLEAGDLLGTGTISAPGKEGYGSLMEITSSGNEPFALPTGEQRRFLEDGDEIVMRAHCVRPGFRTIGFGECRGGIVPAS